MRIKELIKIKGITQKDFAEKLGMSPIGLSQILSGKPSYTTLEKIASALEVEVWELLVSPEEIVRKHSNLKDMDNTQTCPHCGKPIMIRTKLEKTE